MRWLVMVLLMVICILLVLCYSLLVVASREEERANRMYRKWKEGHDGLDE
jgi:hypothetical protein